MSRPARFIAAAIPVAAVLLTAALATRPAPPDAATPPPAIAVTPATDTAVARTDPEPRADPRPAARRALRWLLAAETGHVRPLPGGTFTPPLARDLVARPPRRADGHARPRITALREQSPLSAVHRVLAEIHRAGRREPTTLLLLCRPVCLVAGVE